MTPDQIWQPLVEELASLQRAGRKAEFWLRDDDAVDPTPALDRLLDLTGEFAIPVTLAVIPALTDEKLVARLDETPHATVAIHGWAHRNHAPGDQKKQELGPHRPREAVLDELAIIAQLRHAFDGGQPVGLLTHHLVHDESAWLFLERLLTVTTQTEACVWLPVRTLIGRCAGKGK
ncbi:MAG: hypothetical protein E5V60_10565 [Mesorhizobium sp.]|nr:MAG: hypothetical protein E5V60_10565 [Mesorhizobium sp.]